MFGDQLMKRMALNVQSECKKFML